MESRLFGVQIDWWLYLELVCPGMLCRTHWISWCPMPLFKTNCSGAEKLINNKTSWGLKFDLRSFHLFLFSGQFCWLPIHGLAADRLLASVCQQHVTGSHRWVCQPSGQQKSSRARPWRHNRTQRQCFGNALHFQPGFPESGSEKFMRHFRACCMQPSQCDIIWYLSNVGAINGKSHHGKFFQAFRVTVGTDLNHEN